MVSKCGTAFLAFAMLFRASSARLKWRHPRQMFPNHGITQNQWTYAEFTTYPVVAGRCGCLGAQNGHLKRNPSAIFAVGREETYIVGVLSFERRAHRLAFLRQ
jgi:hypothetical protein